ncbi:hypothetical protein CLOSYM_02455 [[Clostridium] symbiosum ATCC 14940]|uniref:Uncharacterized protein n=1 Tax=[Clostridium] symbiosum ATCC 14940 TaxID=411472 RepID=A0ABC9TXI6_CLOSY|nr:hypothetical protein CLOSYM_02455 [[Clostridium] symbiosum ATCC 14940]
MQFGRRLNCNAAVIRQSNYQNAPDIRRQLVSRCFRQNDVSERRIV